MSRYLNRFRIAYRKGRIYAGILNWFLYPGSSASGRFDRKDDYDNERSIILSVVHIKETKLIERGSLERLAYVIGFEGSRRDLDVPVNQKI